jgi:hypothetical protein
MKILTTAIPVPNITRWQVDSAAFDPDSDVPTGEVRVRFLCAGGTVYGPNGSDADWVLPIGDDAGSCGNISKSGSPIGVRDILIRQPNTKTGVFSLCWAAWRGAANTKIARNNALESILTNANIGLLSANLAGT